MARKKPGPAAIAAFCELERRPSLGRCCAGDQCGCRREILCGVFLMRDFGIGGVAVGLMVGLSCRSGSIEVIWLQASHL